MHWIWNVMGPTFNPLRAPDVTREVVRLHVEARRKAGKSESTINTELRQVRTILNWAAKNRLIKSAPYDGFHRRHRPVTGTSAGQEVERLLVRAELPHLRLFIILAIATAAACERS